MNVQLGMGIAGNAVLIVSAICVLIEWPLIRCDWAAAAGMPLGWLALAGSVAAVAYRAAQQDRRLSANAVGLIGMTAVGLLGCTVCWLVSIYGNGAESAVWGYRTLMLGWAAYALLMLGFARFVAPRFGKIFPETLPDSGAAMRDRAGLDNHHRHGRGGIVDDAHLRQSCRCVVVDWGDRVDQHRGRPAGPLVPAARVCVHFGPIVQLGRAGRLSGLGTEDACRRGRDQRSLLRCRFRRLVVAGASAGMACHTGNSASGRWPSPIWPPSLPWACWGRWSLRRERRTVPPAGSPPGDWPAGLDGAGCHSGGDARLSLGPASAVRAGRIVFPGTVGGWHGAVRSPP